MTESLAAPDPGVGAIQQFLRWFSGRSKTALILSSLVCYAVFWNLSRFSGVPPIRGFDPSLLLSPSPFMSVIVAAVGLVGCSLLMHVLQPHGEAIDPLFAAVVGMAALSWRSGSMTTLVQTSSLSAFFILIVELVLLFAIVGGCALLLQTMRGPDILPADSEKIEIGSFLSAMGTAAVTMIVCMYVLAQSDAKKQALAAVGISAFAGAAIAYSFFAVRSPFCYCGAPLTVGILGYILAYVSPGDWQTGRLAQPLAFGLPLDYASLGVAGSLLGYWTARKWKEEEQG